MNTSHHAIIAAYRACPVVDRRESRAYQAVVDALEVSAGVRELDPREVWGTLAIWGHRDPLRLYALVTALAAMVPVDVPAAELLAWTDSFAQKGAA